MRSRYDRFVIRLLIGAGMVAAWLAWSWLTQAHP